MIPELPQVPEVPPVEADEMVEAGAALIDVRETNEWSEARIPGAQLKPMSEINDWYQDLPRDRRLVFQCKTGIRSAQVVNALMTQAGFDNVTNLTGGIIAWAEAGLPIDTEPA